MVKEASKALTMSNFDKLREFRHKVYTLLGNGKDALFDLMDAVLVSRSVTSFTELSLWPVFRRRWSSLYEAVQDSQPLQGVGLFPLSFSLNFSYQGLLMAIAPLYSSTEQ